MDAVQVNLQASEQLRQAVSEVLGCRPQRTPVGMQWRPEARSGVLGALLHPSETGQRLELDLLLAETPPSAVFSLPGLWDLMANLVKSTELSTMPISCVQGTNGKWQITARLTLRDSVLDLPRLNRLSAALALLDQAARAIQADLPPASAALAPQIPLELREVVHPFTACLKQDSAVGDVTGTILQHLRAGLPVAVSGTPPLRVQLELQRLARLTPLGLLQQPMQFRKLPHAALLMAKAGLTLAAPCQLLRPQVSVYEQGREVEAVLQELATQGLPFLTFGTREELEGVFGVGQGRHHSPWLPIIEKLPPAEGADLVRAALAVHCVGLSSVKADPLIQLVLDAAAHSGGSKMDLLQPLSNLVAKQGPDDPALPTALTGLARDLASRRDTFGTCFEAPAEPRRAEVNRHLLQHLGDSRLAERLGCKILGQETALRETVERIFREALGRKEIEPLRLMLAGPVGTGKSMVAKAIAELLQWPFHYIDAASFDSSHAVMASLAGVSPGIVSSYNDGVLAKISRQPCVVEVADIDHALPGVRSALCEFFLRILQEGTLQTGSGAIIRTLPSVLFVFSSNVAYGASKAGRRVGFAGQPTREEMRLEVLSCAVEYLGQAFVSRVGTPVLFEPFTRQTAVRVAEAEMCSLVGRVTGAGAVELSGAMGEWIVDSLATLETGARGVIDATRDALSTALRDRVAMGVERVVVRLAGERVLVEVAGEQPLPEPVELDLKQTNP